jgi:hypothetical protein
MELLDIHDKKRWKSTRNNGVRTDLTPLIFFGIITLTNEIERSHTNINFIIQITLFSIVKRNDCVLLHP